MGASKYRFCESLFNYWAGLTKLEDTRFNTIGFSLFHHVNIVYVESNYQLVKTFSFYNLLFLNLFTIWCKSVRRASYIDTVGNVDSLNSDINPWIKTIFLFYLFPTIPLDFQFEMKWNFRCGLHINPCSGCKQQRLCFVKIFLRAWCLSRKQVFQRPYSGNPCKVGQLKQTIIQSCYEQP